MCKVAINRLPPTLNGIVLFLAEEKWRMIPAYRNQYNASFTDEKYQKFRDNLDEEAGYKIDFHIAESPLFVPKDFLEKIFQGGKEILSTVLSQNYLSQSGASIPSRYNVPNESKRPTTIAIDFAICKNESGDLIPQLIEMQAFPSLFGYQHWLSKKYREHFGVPETVNHLFSGLTESSYLALLNKWIVSDEDPEQVVLLEVEPEKQKTRVDFELTKKYTGVEYVCISKVIRRGNNLFYKKKGIEIPIRRIYNRVIFDELARRTDLISQYHLTEEANVDWVSHPNWYFRISKFSLPFLRSSYVPETKFLSDVKEIPDDLENYVLKPLFSFAGKGVLFDVTKNDIDQITDRENYILMRKVAYEPVLRAPDGMVKTEVRILYLWLDEFTEPKPVISVVRLSKGKMIGVDFNKNKTWVGGSVGFFEI